MNRIGTAWLWMLLLLAVAPPLARAAPPTDWLNPDPPGLAQIAAASPVAMPGETISLTGTGLADATFELWVNGQVLTCDPLRTADDRAQVIVPTVDPKGQPIPSAPMWLRPMREGQPGLGVGINQPDLWWIWPAQVTRVAGQPDPAIRLFGRQIGLRDTEPLVVWQSVTDGTIVQNAARIDNAYHLIADVPASLPAGDYQVRVMNADLQSKPLALTVVNTELTDWHTLPIKAYLDKHGNLADALDAACDEAQAQGKTAVTLSLGQGIYALNQPVTFPSGLAVRLQGAGMGDSDALSQDAPSQGTVIESSPDIPGDGVLNFLGDGSQIRGLTLIVRSEKVDTGIALLGRDQRVTQVRVVRQAGNPYGSCIASKVGGVAHHVIEDCVLVATHHGYVVDKDTDYVRLANSRLVGAMRQGPGTGANAIAHRGGDHMIVENCTIQSLDWEGGAVFTRTVLLVDGGIHGCYLANNHGSRVGPNLRIPGIDANTGEQYLFHHAGPAGGLYQVDHASPNTLTLDRSLDRHDKPADDWIVFVASGPGWGQWRVLRDSDGKALQVRRPWRVVPESGDRVVIQRGFRDHLIVGNTIDIQAPKSTLRNTGKTIGISLFYCAYGNVIANNTIRDVTTGIQVWSGPTLGSSWNEIRENRIEHIGRYAGGLRVGPAFYRDIVQITDDDKAVDHVMAVGNAFRANRGDTAPVGVRIGWMHPGDKRYLRYPVGAHAGLLMSVIEGNTLQGVVQSLILAPPANGTLYRENVATRAAGAQARESIYRPTQVFDRLILP